MKRSDIGWLDVKPSETMSKEIETELAILL